MKHPFSQGYSLLEVVIYTALVVVVGGITTTLTLQMVLSVGRARASSMALDGARRSIEVLTREISESDALYSATTENNRLSIRTTKGMADDNPRPYVYVDFFVVDGILYKHQEGVVTRVSSDAVTITAFNPTVLYDGEAVSIAVTTEYNTERTDLREQSPVTLHSTITTRSYASQ